MRTPKMTNDQITNALTQLSGWRYENGQLAKTFALPDFEAALAFVQSVGEQAESADHHPDMDIRYTRVTLRFVTHDSGGVTQKDVDGAKAADSLLGDRA